MFFTFLINKHFVFFLFCFSAARFYVFFWNILFSGFSFIFRVWFLRPTRLRFANKLMPNGSRSNVFHDTASRRYESKAAPLEISSQQQQLRHKQRPRNDADCDWGSGQQQQQQQRPRQLIRQRELFFVCFLFGRESRAHGRQTYALSFSLSLSLDRL